MSVSMFSQRALQLSSRRLAATSSLVRATTPFAIATGQHMQLRPAATESVSQSTSTSILAAQRRNRPVSPHISIYRPQITWYASGFNRITGVALSGVMYVFGISYLVAPALGWHLESASIAAAFAAWPIILKVSAKMLLAFPFTFHSLNGLRHLTWDTGAAFTNKQVATTGWTVVGLSAVSALLLTFL